MVKMSKLLGTRTKNIPNDATGKGYQNLLRAGYIKQVSNGSFSLNPPAMKVQSNIERIIREEMDAIDGQEVLMPLVLPRELWEETGRYSTVGDELLRMTDRTGKDILLGMTHEEAAVHLSRNAVNSYNQLPYMIYQIQTKYRDEPRARGGLIRVKEFIMKDAYSFHIDNDDLAIYYKKAHTSYENIFRRIGLKNFISVSSDPGMMGGNVAHEFMLLTDIGEDTIITCDHCGYKANQEVAECADRDIIKNEIKPLKEVFTADAKTIDQICTYLNINANETIKAVCYGNKADYDARILIFLRGDLEVNEAKVKKLLKIDLYPITLEKDDILVAGNIGCLNLPKSENLTIIYDKSVASAESFVIGANKNEYHFEGFNYSRDCHNEELFDISKVEENDKCAHCGKLLSITRGVEIGNIFMLGDKYTKSMGMTVLNNNGKAVTPVMGCYGIGVGRAIACVAEESSDEYGLNWPVSIAPYKVYVCPLKYNNRAKEVADELSQQLTNLGIDIILDDRNVSAGFKFADSELMGVPLRVVISDRTLETESVEVFVRSTREKTNISLNEVVNYITNYLTNNI